MLTKAYYRSQFFFPSSEQDGYLLFSYLQFLYTNLREGQGDTWRYSVAANFENTTDFASMFLWIGDLVF